MPYLKWRVEGEVLQEGLNSAIVEKIAFWIISIFT